MSKYSIDSTTLTGIADAIRAKDGSSSPIVVSDFATKITNIPATVSGGDDSSISNLPYDLLMFSGESTITQKYYQNYGAIVIPYSIWSKFSSINFNYALNDVLRVTSDMYSCHIQILIHWVTYDESQAWQAATSGYSYSSSGIISTLITDFEGSVSSTYNLDCTNLTPPSDTRKDLAIIVQVKKKPDTNYPYHTFKIKIGNFKGVKA